jgi:hypothetical protein
MGGSGAGPAPRKPPRLPRRGPHPPRRDPGRRRRGTAIPGRFRQRRQHGLRAPGRPRRTSPCTGRGRHRHRQDPRLRRPRQPLGGTQRRPRLDRHLHPQPATSAGPGTRPPLPGPGGAPSQGRHPQGAGKLSLPAEFRRSRQRRHARPHPRLGPRRPLGRRLAGRRPDGRRLPRLDRRAVPLRRRLLVVGPSRRVHPLRLPALEALLRRAFHPPRRHRQSGGGQPRPRHGPGRPRPKGRRRLQRGRTGTPLCLRRRPPPVRRGGWRLLRRPLRRRDGGAAPLAARQ